MAITLTKILKTIFIYGIAIIIAVLIPYRIGGAFLAHFDAGSTFYFIFNSVRWLLIITIALLVPHMFLSKKDYMGKLMKVLD